MSVKLPSEVLISLFSKEKRIAYLFGLTNNT